ncbi:hypothetical protein PVAND_014565 [Polypedilum vanderplanki]|uniref:Uncharacterized protein n=1 Tax=Polypedilum vanderplanki TaxID=319348 RepID=A0A9J6BAK4_POLVA|nr:hypothetical protein PVAND_014565 [Polypedilum vanderplanki]
MKFKYKVLLIIFLTFDFKFVKSLPKDFQYAKLKLASCKLNEKYVKRNDSKCFAKAISRNSSSMNAFLFYTRPIFFTFGFTIYYKYGTIYRPVLTLPKIDFCWSVKSLNLHPIFREFFNVAKTMNSSFIHNCPYYEMVFNNSIIDIGSFTAIFPRGDYKTNFSLYEKKSDEWIWTMDTAYTIFSSEIYSWG